MFFAFIWGKRKTKTQMGVAADFCPVCHKIAPFAVSRLGMASHVYFVPVGQGDFRGYTQTCVSCETPFKSDPDRFSRLIEYAGMSIERLVEETNPSLHEQFSERLALEERIAADPHAFDLKTRQSIVMEPFQLAAPLFRIRKSEMGLRVLARALRPLEPTEDEVRACLSEFRRTGAAIGFELRTAKVMKILNKKSSPHDYDY